MKFMQDRLFSWLRLLIPGRFGRGLDQCVGRHEAELKTSTESYRGQTHSISFRPRLSRLADPVEVAATLPVLESLSRHLQQTAIDLQESVLEISSGFGGMAEQARETVQIAQSGLQNHDGRSTDGTIGEIRCVLHSLLSAVQDSSQLSLQLSGRIGELEKVLAGVTQSLVRVEKIADEARIVGLIGRLEAARAGSHGAAFNVVASETKNLATNASETSASIRRLVQQLDVSLRSVSADLQERIVLDADVAKRSQETVTQLLDQLSVMHHGMTESLQKTESISEALTREIGRSVMALQFQDRVNQRLDHVSETLLALHENLLPFAAKVSASQADARADDWREWLSSRSTMTSERVLIAHSGESVSSGGKSDCGSVELF
jgi:methyl-accepting chemotaxis protein